MPGQPRGGKRFQFVAQIGTIMASSAILRRETENIPTIEIRETMKNHTYFDGQYQCGDIVLAGVMNPLQNPSTRGKFRPVVLVYREHGHWSVMGLTTLSAYADGAARTAVPDSTSVGLRGPGYLWGDRLTNVSVLDLDRRIGGVDSPLAEAIIESAKLSADDADELRGAADGRSEDYGLAGH